MVERVGLQEIGEDALPQGNGPESSVIVQVKCAGLLERLSDRVAAATDELLGSGVNKERRPPRPRRRHT